MKAIAHFFAASAAFIAVSSPVQAETMTNDKVVLLHNAGISDDVIVAKIKSSEVDFDTSTNAVIHMSEEGLSGRIIAAMVERKAEKSTPVATLSIDSPDPMVPHPAGLYLYFDRPSAAKMERIDYTVSSQAKTGGIFGYALTGGIASMSVKVSIANESARTDADTRQPVFYFFFDESNPATASSSSPWAGAAVAAAASPNEFTLIELKQKKGRREARVGSMNIGGSKMGVMDKDRLSFHYDMVRQGVYKVTPDNELEPGEYGFIQAMPGAAVGGAMSARVFDFTVK